MSKFDALDKKCVNSIRCFCADMVQGANSGHPGAPMGMAPMSEVLFTRFLMCDPKDCDWMNRDRFVLSNGHASTLQYTLLHLLGYDISLDDCKSFRQLGSKTPGHPESHLTPGIEVTSGPLGQGISNAIGMAITRDHFAAVFNKPNFPVIDHNIFVFCGDGCLMEGVASEACSLAGHLKLGSLVVLYDDNHITIDGNTDVAFTENVLDRFKAYGWHTQTVSDGNADLDSIHSAIEVAISEKEKPSIIAVKTTIGLGAAHQDTAKVHGSPLGDEDIKKVKTMFGLDPEKKYNVDGDVRKIFTRAAERGIDKHTKWNAMMAEYSKIHGDLAKEFTRRAGRELPAIGLDELLPKFTPEDKPIATRKLSEAVLNKLAPHFPELMGGSADLTGSNNTYLKCSHDYQPSAKDGRYLRFGVREHAMCAIANGMAAYGGVIPFTATFLTFIGYAQGAARISALAGHHVIHIMTHDSIGVGEDGPTHQPVETLMSYRGTPGYLVFRPADGNETSGAYKSAITHRAGPSILALTRQNLPQLKGSSVDAVAKGAYILQDCEGKPDLIVVSTGSEVHLCVNAVKDLNLKVRIVSAPCLELFAQQDIEYQKKVFAETVPVLSVEAGITFGWQKYAHASMGIDSFGVSAPAHIAFKHFGLTEEKVAEKCVALVDFYKAQSVPWLVHRPF